MKKVLIVAICAHISSISILAQSVAPLDTDDVLDLSSLTGAQAVALVLEAARLPALPPGRGSPAEAARDRPVRAGEFCQLLMRVFGLNGGLGYAVSPSPRAAFHEFLYRQWVRLPSDPDDVLTGPEALRILRKVLESGVTS